MLLFSDVNVEETTAEVQKVPDTSSCSTQTVQRNLQLLSAKLFALEPKTIHYYTGLETYEKFCMVLDTLGPSAYSLKYFMDKKPTLSVEDQFFLTLVKLRLHPPHQELSILFGITEKEVSSIFVTWINFMYMQWSEIKWWPSRELVSYFMPTDFGAKYPKTRIIVDGTECPINKPTQPVAQQATFSTYKNRNTLKVVVGSTPGGLISYISPAFGGSTSDRQIVESTALPKLFDANDEVMADKGFNVEDMFIPYKVGVNIPTFFKKKNRLSSAVVLKDRKIASKRVHIERLIGLAKTYKILVQSMNHMESSLGTQIITVCFLLCNFRKCIVSPNA